MKKLNKLHHILVLFLCVVFNSVYCNSKSDSLRLVWQNEQLLDSARFEALDEYYELYVNITPDSVLSSLNYYYDLATRKKADRQIYRSLLRKGNVYRNQNKYQDAISNYSLARSAAQKLNNSQLEAIVIGNFGNIHLDQKNYFEAIKFYNEAKDIFVEKNDFNGEGRMLNGIGAINSIIGNYDLALSHYSKALTAYNKADISYLDLALISMNIGLIHCYRDSLSKAENAFNDAIKILDPKNDIFYLKDCYLMLGNIKLELSDLQSADWFATKSLELNNQLGIGAGILSSKVLKAMVLYETNKEKAVLEMEGLLPQVGESSDFELKQTVYEFLYDAYKHNEKWEVSLKMHELLLACTDTLDKRKNSYKVAREAVKNEYKAKLHENQLQFENEKAELKIKQVKRTFSVILGLIVILLLVSYLFFLKNKKNRRQRNLLLMEIRLLKNQNLRVVSNDEKYELNREKLDNYIKRNLNETDWLILQVLLLNPTAMNKEISEKVNLSIDGVGSSLRRMYDYFEIHDTKYKKVALLHKVIKVSEFKQQIDLQ